MLCRLHLWAKNKSLADEKPARLLASSPKQVLRSVQWSIAVDYLVNPKFWGRYLLKSVRSFVHNILLVGSPGAGKTLLARAMPGILPEMSIDESLDVTRIYSVADQLPAGTLLIRHRSFRAPHHTVSHAGLVGGGNMPKPGEISLAQRSLLLLKVTNPN